MRSDRSLWPQWLKDAPAPLEVIEFLVGDLTRYGLPAPNHPAYATHPIVNSEVLQHLVHGRLRTKPDVQRLDGDGLIFSYGSREQIDLVLCATGYTHALPFLEPSLFEWRGDRPTLYLNLFHTSIEGLFVLGFIEFSSGVHAHFDAMAQLNVAIITADDTTRRRFEDLKLSYRSDLCGGRTYLESARNANYIDASTYQQVIREV